jgi:branched-chain amino acid transport system permease protein
LARPTIAGPLTDGLIAALLAAILGLPLIGFQLVDRAGGEGLATRWPDLGAAVALVFAGRAALSTIGQGRFRAGFGIAAGFAIIAIFVPWPSGFLRVTAVGGAILIAVQAAAGWIRRRGTSPLSSFPRRREPTPPPARAEGWVPAFAGMTISKELAKAAPWALILFALALPLLPFTDRYVLDVAIRITTYVMLGWGLNIVTGLAGLLDLGYAAFFAIGAYAMAILGVDFGWSFWECLPVAALAAAAAGVLLGFPVLGLRGDYFAIVTLGFGEIIRIVANNWRALTNGSQGIGGVPRLSFFGLADFSASPAPGKHSFSQMFGIPYAPIQRIVFLYYVIVALALAVNLFTRRIRVLPIGRAWEALREDDIAAQALGIDRRRVKLAAFAIGAAWGGVAGAFFATQQGFVSPESFGFMESVTITAIVVLGGMGSQMGIVLAAILIIGLPELFRFLQEYRTLAFGAAMIAIMRFRPRGLIPARRPSVTLT